MEAFKPVLIVSPAGGVLLPFVSPLHHITFAYFLYNAKTLQQY